MNAISFTYDFTISGPTPILPIFNILHEGVKGEEVIEDKTDHEIETKKDVLNEEFSCSSFLYYGLWYQWMVGLDFVLTAAAACELEWMVDGIRFADIPEL